MDVTEYDKRLIASINRNLEEIKKEMAKLGTDSQQILTIPNEILFKIAEEQNLTVDQVVAGLHEMLEIERTGEQNVH